MKGEKRCKVVIFVDCLNLKKNLVGGKNIEPKSQFWGSYGNQQSMINQGSPKNFQKSSLSLVFLWKEEKNKKTITLDVYAVFVVFVKVFFLRPRKLDLLSMQ